MSDQKPTEQTTPTENNKGVLRRHKKRIHHQLRTNFHTLKWRNLGSRARALTVITLVALVGVAATFYTQAAQLSSEETVTLSNRQEIRLGESINSVSQKLGSNLYKINSKQYSYPGKANKPIEVVIDTEDGKVAVIHLVNNSANTSKANGATVGLKFQQVSAKDRRAEALSGPLAQLRQKGLTIDQSRSKQYFFPDRCKNGDEVRLVSIAIKGAENRVSEDLGGSGCIDDD